MSDYLSHKKGRLAILAGQGDLPRHVEREAIKQGYAPFIVELSDPEWDFQNSSSDGICALDGINKILTRMKQAGCDSVVLVGYFARPPTEQVQNMHSAMGKEMAENFQGDDKLLRSVGEFFAREGITPLPAALFLSPLLLRSEDASEATPTEMEKRDIDKGIRLLQAMGKFDVAQALVIVEGCIVALEAAEGTDAMLERAAHLKQKGSPSYAPMPRKCGILVKIPKSGQSLDYDLPVIGEKTIMLAKKAGLNGIACSESKTILLDKERVLESIGRASMFLYVAE